MRTQQKSIKDGRTRWGLNAGQNRSWRMRLSEDLARCTQCQGRPALSEKLWRQCYDDRVAAHGTDHLHTLQCSEGLAASLAQQGRFNEAETVTRQALVLHEAALAGTDVKNGTSSLGPAVGGYLRCRLQLVEYLMIRQQYDEAQIITARVLVIVLADRAVYGVDAAVDHADGVARDHTGP
eukprot:7771-Heterococcus_DN1.PRE.3